MWGEIATSFQNRDFYVLSMLFLGFMVCTLIFERMIMYFLVYNIDFVKFSNNLKKMIASKDFDRAMNLCKKASPTSLPKIALRALEASENDPTAVKGVIEEGTMEFLPRIEARLSMLPMFATVILLLGILGTMDQLWGAFHSIDVLDSAKKQAVLASGIAGSLNPTALGLVFSIVILFFHQILKSAAIGILEHVQLGVSVLSNLLVSEVSFMPSGMNFSAPTPSMESEAPQAEAAPVAQEEEKDEPFENPVEDIKDEEEII